PYLPLPGGVTGTAGSNLGSPAALPNRAAAGSCLFQCFREQEKLCRASPQEHGESSYQPGLAKASSLLSSRTSAGFRLNSSHLNGLSLVVEVVIDQRRLKGIRVP